MSRATSRMSAVRAAVRVARRDVWRNLMRSSLIAIMVALPVLATSTVSVIYRSDQRDPQDTVQAALGDQAQALISYRAGERITQGPDGQEYSGEFVGPGAQTQQQAEELLQARLPAQDRLVPELVMYVPAGLRHNGQRLDAEIRELDYTAAGLGGLVEQISGRAPATPGEVAISRTMAHRTGVRVGDTLSLVLDRQATPKPLRVVGVVGGASLVGSESVIGLPRTMIPADSVELQPGTLGGRAGISWRVVGPDPVTWDQVRELNAIGGAVTSRQVVLNPPGTERGSLAEDFGSSSSDRSSVGIAVVVIGLALLQIALLAGPAIAVGARRNQHGLAIMASVGAERRHLRTVLLASSGVIGVVAGLVAAALGAGLGAVIVAVLIHRDNDHLLRVDIHPLDLLGLAAVGGLTAIAAALIPARQAARLDVVAVLTGRRGQLPSRLRVPLVGLLLTAVGVLLAYLLSGRHRPFPTVAALALAEIGLITATGAVVSLAARAAVRLPFATRFALRDAARQRSRTVPAVAAVLAAVAGASCALIYVATQAAQDEASYSMAAPLGTAIVNLEGPTTVTEAELSEIETAIRRTLPVAAIARYRAIEPSTPDQYVGLEVLVPPENQCPTGRIAGLPEAARQRAYASDPRCSSRYDGPSSGVSETFDDGSGYPVLAGEPGPAAVSALRAGRVVIEDPRQLWPDGTVHINLNIEDEDSEHPDEVAPKRTVVLPATVVTAPEHLMLPVYPLTAAKALGVTLQVRDVGVATTRMPTRAEETAADNAVQDLGDFSLWVERGYRDTWGLGLLALVIAAGVVGLGGTFTAVGLAAAETRADVATLAAVGASPGVRRRLAAGQAGVIAGLGTGLGVFGGVIAGWALVRMKQPTGSSAYLASAGLAGYWRLVLPWSHLLALGIGIPVLAVLVAYLTTRSRLPLVRRLER